MTRVFFIVDSLKDAKELYETLEEAEKHFSLINKVLLPKIYIGLVKNAYKENGKWNYDDRNDTFTKLKIIKE